MKKTEFLKSFLDEHAAWEAQLNRVEAKHMMQPNVVGSWSVKDLIAHVTWSEREMVGMLESMTLAGSELWNLTNDERNRVVYEQNRQRPLDEVVSEAQSVYQRLLALIQNLSEQALNDPQYFKDMPSDWIPWRVIQGNTYKHYHEHSQDLQRWLDGA